MSFQVIEDMSIQVNIPALAMEEVPQSLFFSREVILFEYFIHVTTCLPWQVAPVAVSDAAMLAPEEVFEGKGDIKEDVELTQAERKRRRANKKRRYAGIFFLFGVSLASTAFEKSSQETMNPALYFITRVVHGCIQLYYSLHS